MVLNLLNNLSIYVVDGVIGRLIGAVTGMQVKIYESVMICFGAWSTIIRTKKSPRSKDFAKTSGWVMNIMKQARQGGLKNRMARGYRRLGGVVLLGCMAATAQVSADVDPAALVPANEQIPVTEETQVDVIPQDTALVTKNTGLDLGEVQSAEVVVLSESAQPLDVSAHEGLKLDIEADAGGNAYEQVALSSPVANEDYAVTEVREHPVSSGKRAADDSFNGMTIGSSSTSEQKQLPYALILALVALIGLVPVSRRYH